MAEDAKYWIWFGSLLGLSVKKRMKLLEVYGAPVNVWHASKAELAATGIPNAWEIGELTSKTLRAEAAKYLERIHKYRIRVMNIQDANYPRYLKEIQNPPLVLYVKGKLVGDECSVAVVGSRKATTYGLSMAESLSYDLAVRGVTVVSGMARGIDSRAHMGALKARGRTVAVLGCGLDKVYPPENKELAQEIMISGAIVSEYLPGVEPRPFHFPARNRIISGMSLGTVIIEAGERSGSLITADFALEQGREVFAVPGNIDSRTSVGTNRLIREGAKIVTTVEDILEELKCDYNVRNKSGFEYNKHKQGEQARRWWPDDLDEMEKKVLEEMGEEVLHIDIISKKCGLSVQHIGATLVMLELKGIVEQMPGKLFRLKK